MSNNFIGEQPPLGPDNIPVIPTPFITEAILEEAQNIGGRRLRREAASIILTSNQDLPSDVAISRLEEVDPDSVGRILSRATVMHQTGDIKRQQKEHRKLARKEERPEWFRSFGHAIFIGVANSTAQGAMVMQQIPKRNSPNKK
jgi:hypothetical protein